MYICKLCSFSTTYAIRDVKHCRVHSNHSVIPCGVPHCGHQFRKISTFYSHVSRCHGILRRQTKYSFLYTAGIMVKCNVRECDKVMNFTELVRHLKGHIDSGIKVNCPVQNCGRLISKKSTFTAHISVKHGMINKTTIDNNLLVDCPNAGITDCDDTDVDNSSVALPDETDVGSANSEADDVDIVDKDTFMHNFALFFLKLQCRFNVPASTVELIVREMHNLHQQNCDVFLQAVQSQFGSEGTNGVIIQDIVDAFKQSDLFSLALNSDDGLLRSQHKRKCFYREKLKYVEPLEQKLGENKYGRLCVYHYIPVHQTLQSLLQDPSLIQQVNSCSCSNHDMFTDLHDGQVYKQIRQTVNQLPLLEIILYEDAFEIVNPIGSARKVHKIVALYMALGNLPVHQRMNIDNLQLVLLCRETDMNYFGQEKVFQCLVKDLQELECNGVNVNDHLYAVRLVCFLGDNLGSHWLGGFSTNFSVNTYICRYCTVKRTEENSSLCKTGELRTPELYNNAVNSLSDTVLSFQGVVRPSVFNHLKYYHVCLPGLPPCLGHDLFEGVVQFDLSLMLKHLCRSSTGNCIMSYKYLNHSIKQFRFLGSDANDKPGVVSDGKAVGGNAAQVWCLLRLLPLLLYDVVNVQDDVWRMLILLREIVDLVCAPKISFAQILYLNRLICQYVEDRSKLFQSVPMRPKHHYLLHYPWLIQMFGPLMRVWTMRMESKHACFKRCARSCRNFINVTKTLSETHQLSKAFLSSGPLICRYVELGSDACDYNDELFCTAVVSAVKSCASLNYPVQCSSNVTVKGTKYFKGAFVVISCFDSLPIFGKVLLCLLDSKGTAAVVVEECKSEKNHSLGLFTVQCSSKMLKCVLIEELFDYYPLPAYDVSGVPHIALKHAVYIGA